MEIITGEAAYQACLNGLSGIRNGSVGFSKRLQETLSMNLINSMARSNSGILPPAIIINNRSDQAGPTMSPEYVWGAFGYQPGRLKTTEARASKSRYQDLAGLRKLMFSDFWRKQKEYVVEKEVGTVDVCMNYYTDGKNSYFLFVSERDKNRGVNFQVCHDIYCQDLTDNFAKIIPVFNESGFFEYWLRCDPANREAWIIGCKPIVTTFVYQWCANIENLSSDDVPSGHLQLTG
ncbi:hypothetical protein H6785_02860 [Candidatus Nomurabacteria bacterium]|nr:hypothetical protein [Candidatus Kaiserbacteria bacterium]MCB9815488.1 hypothetical protein [Candidatus Nomurabacteria bacterium]